MKPNPHVSWIQPLQLYDDSMAPRWPKGIAIFARIAASHRDIKPRQDWLIDTADGTSRFIHVTAVTQRRICVRARNRKKFPQMQFILRKDIVRAAVGCYVARRKGRLLTLAEIGVIERKAKPAA